MKITTQKALGGKHIAEIQLYFDVVASLNQFRCVVSLAAILCYDPKRSPAAQGISKCRIQHRCRFHRKRSLYYFIQILKSIFSFHHLFCTAKGNKFLKPNKKLSIQFLFSSYIISAFRLNDAVYWVVVGSFICKFIACRQHARTYICISRECPNANRQNAALMNLIKTSNRISQNVQRKPINSIRFVSELVVSSV